MRSRPQSTKSDNASSTDGRNVVSWSDPNNKISGSFACGSGGTLAVAGPWWGGATSVVNGVTYNYPKDVGFMMPA